MPVLPTKRASCVSGRRLLQGLPALPISKAIKGAAAAPVKKGRLPSRLQSPRALKGGGAPQRGAAGTAPGCKGTSPARHTLSPRQIPACALKGHTASPSLPKRPLSLPEKAFAPGKTPPSAPGTKKEGISFLDVPSFFMCSPRRSLQISPTQKPCFTAPKPLT